MKSLYLQCSALVLASIGAVNTAPLARGDDSATDHAASIRVPVYSSDPSLPTTLSRISLLRRAADGEAMTTGDVLGGVIGFVLYVALPAYAVGKRMHEAFDMDLDLSGSEVPDIPEVPPPDTADEKQ